MEDNVFMILINYFKNEIINVEDVIMYYRIDVREIVIYEKVYEICINYQKVVKMIKEIDNEINFLILKNEKD